MGRRARRWVSRPPENFYFFNQVLSETNSIVLNIAEFEALRLKHYMNHDQITSATQMGISQSTFSRILDNAHQKITLALMDGKEIKVHAGEYDYRIKFTGYGCLECNHEWEDQTASKEKKVNCIKCQSPKVYFIVREQI